MRIRLFLLDARQGETVLETWSNFWSKTNSAADVDEDLAPDKSSRHAQHTACHRSKDEWAKIQKKEADAKKKKNFGAGGTRGFESRSMASTILAIESAAAWNQWPPGRASRRARLLQFRTKRC